MIVGIGMDLCEIDRMRRAVERPRFLERVFTEAEARRVREASDIRRAEIAAGLFAAKEAVAKALGTGFAGFGPGDIEIIPDPAGRPVCALHGGALALLESLGASAPWVSITHEKGMAGAVAVVERQQATGNRQQADSV